MFAQLAMPDAVLSHFIEREADDGCLTVEGSKQLDIFFVHPAQWRHDKISVAKNYVVRTPPFSGNKADAYVEYIALGELDSQLGANGDVVRQDYKLVLGNKYSLVARGNTPAAEVIDPSRWRIELAGGVEEVLRGRLSTVGFMEVVLWFAGSRVSCAASIRIR